MPTAFNLRKLIHRKSAEMLAPLPAGNTIAGGFILSDKSEVVPGKEQTFYIGGVSAIWRYSADEDAWQQLPNSGIAGTFGAGACGDFRGMSAPGGVQLLTALAGGTTTVLPTSLTLVRSLKGRRVRIVNGPGAGFEAVIAHNTLGVNSIITLETAAGAAFTVATQFQLSAGSLWFFNSGAGAVGFAVYDMATNTWTQRGVVNIPTSWGNDAQLVSTGSLSSNGGLGFVNGTTASATTTTLTDGIKAWPVNGWANAQVRIKAGTGAGQVRSIASNTATVLTIGTTWTVTPDATSIYVIEANDDFMYLGGNNAVTLYRYSISANAWTVLAPTTARTSVYAAGGTMDYIDATPDWQEGSAGLYGPHAVGMIRQNGRYIYSFRGGGSSLLDIYDIAANTWITGASGVLYGEQGETFNAGSCSVDVAGQIILQKEATGRFFRFDVANHVLLPFFVSPMPQGGAVAGDKMIVQTYKDGTSVGRWCYSLGHTRNEFIRFFMV